jgi:2-polyprenyl-3-methyl-5-hydroxy-6-metoxy-1,4-benzoquinol methylase
VSRADRERWDAKYGSRETPTLDDIRLPAVFEPFVTEFPTAGSALEIACGRGGTAVWLARRGLEVVAVDVSPVAIAAAQELVRLTGVRDRCRFAIADLDQGLPSGPAVDVLVCHLFRDPRLDDAMMERLAPGGLLAVACRSEVDGVPGPYRAGPGELLERFAGLDTVAAGEGDGRAWLLSRRGRGSTPTSASR